MKAVKSFDVLVIGAGSGLDVASFAASKGMKVALVEEGPMGGTCLNRGCIPSKMLIHSADVADTINSSRKFGIKATIQGIDFSAIVKHVSDYVDNAARQIETGIRQSSYITHYKTKSKFIGKKLLQVHDETITADKIIIAGGARAVIPPINGLDSVPYLTSKEALRLQKQPEHLVIIGGGYISAELAHFFGALGTKITMLVRDEVLIRNEDSEIARWFTDEFSKRYDIRFRTEAESLYKEGKNTKIKLKDSDEVITADQLLIATGIRSNADILDARASNIETNEKGYIKVNDYFETNVEDIWAFGDITGLMPFKHVANDQVGPVIHNAFFGQKETVDYRKIPHAVFSSPQVAGVGYTEDELKQKGINYKVGKYELKNTGMGSALQDNGLVKILVGKEDKILGGHIVGPDATTLIHEIVIAMNATGKTNAITKAVYAHPALSEWVQRAFYSVA
ncbi:dihydrolipoyl dehydrogenase [Candidatus Saccharibacteria bacterium]|nr:dihydrolipoyl dehydrogenase [Candidatus Saccharibacteria bacterium]